ncbi:sulfurtransferase TusA family protein [Acidaminobacter hydrogenoformans]|uniref:TusA-related sulfurtransferase n=1 Tax=Acidaminobacter hydrogenoformans DSM 2784 TaxID=1120920 RepID=A0A1G5RZ41_9FIRM|nr:sulfurtransferase TusA family protein [Acidaminobacter hydrogenoformans]SCZ79415.1 TusA-related sulfurtransferase [Acidaminobacter hydrogenoformans DSM 2784]
MPIDGKIDCFGDICPVPLIKLERALKNIGPGDSVTLVTDHSCVPESVMDKFGKQRLQIDSDEVMNGIWEITVTKCHQE